MQYELYVKLSEDAHDEDIPVNGFGEFIYSIRSPQLFTQGITLRFGPCTILLDDLLKQKYYVRMQCRLERPYDTSTKVQLVHEERKEVYKLGAIRVHDLIKKGLGGWLKHKACVSVNTDGRAVVGSLSLTKVPDKEPEVEEKVVYVDRWLTPKSPSIMVGNRSLHELISETVRSR